MFQFTTTTVINSLKDFTTGKNLITFADGVLRIKRLNPFKKDNICKIWKSVHVDPSNDVLTLSDLIGQGADKRVGLYIRSVGNADPMYANDLVFKGKPLYIEIPAGTDKYHIVEVVNKYMNLVFGGVMQLIPSVEDSTKLVLTAVNPYQRITKVTVATRDADTKEFGDGVAQDLATVLVSGNEGFGDYDHILKDLRLPTGANLRWKRTMEDEMPVPGASYDEYVIDYEVDRGNMGISAVGQKVVSKTTHVLFVNSAIAADFETALGGAADKLEQVKTPAEVAAEIAAIDAKYTTVNSGADDDGNEYFQKDETKTVENERYVQTAYSQITGSKYIRVTTEGSSI